MADEKKPEDAKAKLEGLLGKADEGKKEGSPFSFMSGGAKPAAPKAPTVAAPAAGAAPAPAAAPGVAPAAAAAPMTSEITDRIRRLEDDVTREKEKAMRAEILLKERENVRLEMENMFRTFKDQVQKEKADRELENERLGAKARVETLEKRLDEMNQLLLNILKEQKEASPDRMQGELLKESLKREAQMNEELRKKEEEVSLLRTQKEAEISTVRAQLDGAVRKAEEDTESKDRNLMDQMRLDLLERTKEITRLQTVQENLDKLKKDHAALQELVGPEGAPMKELVKTLRNELEMQQRQIQSLKSTLGDLQARYELLQEEKRSLTWKLKEKDSDMASGRLKDLPREIENLEKAALEILESAQSPSGGTIEFFQKLFEEKETELARIKDRIGKGGGGKSSSQAA